MSQEEDPFRLRVLKAICACIETICPDNGYKFDLRPEILNSASEEGTIHKVFRGKDVFSEADPLPMVYVLEAPQALDQIGSQSDNPSIKGPWELLIGGFTVDDPNHPTDPAHKLMGEVKAALAKEKKRTRPMSQITDFFGLGDRKTNSIQGFQVSPGIVRPPDDLSPKAYFYLTVTLTITEDTSQPYA